MEARAYLFPISNSVVGSKHEQILKNVFPAAQKDVNIILDYLDSHSTGIECVVLFGSSVTIDFGPGSDLDIAIITDNDSSEDEFSSLTKGLRSITDKNLDIINFRSVKSDLLKQEIRKKGLVIYGSSTLL